MTLTDSELIEALENGEIDVFPIDDPDLQIQPASIDVRLSNEFLTFQAEDLACIHPDNEDEIDKYTEMKEIDEDGEFILHPDDFVLGSTYETFNLPNDVVGRVEGRSSLGRLAIIVHATAGFVDPGFEGKITLELSNLGNAPVALTPKMRIAQMTFERLDKSADRPYGSDRESKYQNQEGPEMSKLQSDPEFSD